MISRVLVYMSFFLMENSILFHLGPHIHPIGCSVVFLVLTLLLSKKQFSLTSHCSIDVSASYRPVDARELPLGQSYPTRCTLRTKTSSSLDHVDNSSQRDCRFLSLRILRSFLSTFHTCYTPLPLTRFTRSRVTPFMTEDKYDALQTLKTVRSMSSSPF